jgi:hypothetical protein
MNFRFLRPSWLFFAVSALLCLWRVSAAGQTTTVAAPSTSAAQPKTWTQPRTAFGDPDLQGIWNNDAENAVPLEVQPEGARRAPRPDDEGAGVGGGPEHWGEGVRGKVMPPSSRKSLIVDPPDGKLPPLTPEGQKNFEAKEAARRQPGLAGALARLHAWDYCITRGVPDSMLPRLYGNEYQIVQAPGYVAIYHEMIHDIRIIPLDGRPHLPQTVRQWMGDSRGHWEGKTLVVETTNFSAKTENNLIPHVGAGSYRGAGESLHLVERFTRLNEDTMDYRFTMDDPNLYTRPWTAALTLTTKNSPDRIFEYACHEGNYALPDTISGALAEERAAEAAAKKK